MDFTKIAYQIILIDLRLNMKRNIIHLILTILIGFLIIAFVLNTKKLFF